jgi:hypothetical protein
LPESKKIASSLPALSSDEEKDVRMITLLEDYQMLSTIGCGSIVKLAAAEPFRTNKLQPFFTVAHKKFNNNPISDVIGIVSSGYLFCNGNFIENTGIPFLVEGKPFIC